MTMTGGGGGDVVRNSVKGWYSGNFVGNGRFEVNSGEECRTEAARQGYPAFGYRNANHSQNEYKNTCFFYSGTGNIPDDRKNDDAHVVACTDETKSWPVCREISFSTINNKYISSGNDVNNSVWTPGNIGVDACRIKCKENGICKGITYNKNNECWLKTNTSHKGTSNDWTTEIKQ